MIKNGLTSPSYPVVGWQGQENRTFRLLRVDELKGQRPQDGHDPGAAHRIEFHALMLVANGSFDHWIDFQTHRFRKNQLIYIAPNQIHRFVENRHQQAVWALIFRPEIFPAGLQQMQGGKAPWSIVSYLWPCITKLKSAETALILDQFEFLRRLQSVCPNDCRESANHFVRGVIGLAFEFANRNHPEPMDIAANPRFFEFVQRVEAFFDSRRDVKWYAEQMDCSQRTLNRACQETLGESAKSLLSRRVVIEAKRYLTQSNDSVSAVAEKLGFGETTNFVRYFRKETGMTPQVFRNSQESA